MAQLPCHFTRLYAPNRKQKAAEKPKDGFSFHAANFAAWYI
jgi:hypothetical protein